MSEIGSRRRAIDWQARTSGALAYSGDVALEGLLEAAVLRSPHPHARIVAIDTAAAQAMAGVRAIITAADFPPGARYIHEGARDRPPLADGVVCFSGQEIAAVAAESRAQAEAATRAIVVEYQVLNAPLTTAMAFQPGIASMHRRPTGIANLSHRVTRDWGDAAAGRQASTVAVSGDYYFPRQAHACMETNISVASWDEAAQKLHFWTSTQAPYYVVHEVAAVMGLAVEQVVCREVGVGGGFGSKSKICDHEALSGALSRKARAPVRLRLSREEEFATTKTRHAFAMSMALHADEAGRLRAIDATLDVENGAFNHSGVSVMSAGIKGLGMMYRPDGLTATGRLIDTATTPGGSFRGYGSIQASFAAECLMDELAEKLQLDPIELRLRNANQAGETTLVGGKLSSARLSECLIAARDALGWEREKSERRPGRGVGIASGVHVSGSFTAPGANRSDAAIDVLPDSRIRVRFGGADAGTGQKTILAQIAADELGVAFDAVDVVTMESEQTPFDMGAWSSRGTHFGGHAVRKAARAMAARLRALAAAKLAGDLALRDGAVHGDGGSLPLGVIAQLSNEAKDGVLTVETSFVEEKMEPADRVTGLGNVSASYNFAAHGAVIEVDWRTGKVTIVDYVAAHDIGTALNPMMTESQAIGGAAMGLGVALGEEVIFEQGRVVNPAYLHYALPRAADLPRIRPILVEGGDPNGPYGAKAIGECSINPPPAAIANAIYDAIGIRIRDLPITPDKIINALAQREARRRDHAIWRRPSRWWIALVRWAYPRGLLKFLHRHAAPLPIVTEPAPVESVAKPASLAQLRAMMAPDAALLGGGTDLQVQRRQGLIAPLHLVATTKVAEMRGVRTLPDGRIEIGAAVTLAALATALGHRVPIIAQTIAQIASAQIREMATVGGNLVQAKRCWFYRNNFGCYKRMGGMAPCYAVAGDHRFYHAAIDGHRCQAVTPSDLATTLVALDAEAVIATRQGERVVAVVDLYTGPGETQLREGEVLCAIRLPQDASERFGAFFKLKLWEGDFAVVAVAMTARVDPAKRWRAPRIVFGALAPTPFRARASEHALDGRAMTVGPFRKILDRELDRVAHPLSRNGWKLDAAAGLAEHAFEAIDRAAQAAPLQESA